MPAIQLSTFELIRALSKVFSLQKLSIVGEREVVITFDELSDIRVLEGRKIMVAGDYGKVLSVARLCDDNYEVCINGVKFRYNGEIDVSVIPLGAMLIFKEADEE